MITEPLGFVRVFIGRNSAQNYISLGPNDEGAPSHLLGETPRLI